MLAGGLLLTLLLVVGGVVPLTRGLYLWPVLWGAATALLGLTRFRPFAVIALSVLAGGAAFSFLILLNFKPVRVEGESMLPTLQQGDVLLIDLTEPPTTRYDIFVLEVSLEERSPLIKRLVGLPGETMDVRYGRVFADDAEVYPRDGTAPDTWNENLPANARFYTGPRKLEAGQYFFLGDNPPHSRDSRHFGSVPEGGIEGRAVWSLRGSHGFGVLK